MFFGTYTPRLDDKGRLFLPAKFRDELAEGLVVTRGQERCLYVWSMEEFGKLTERLRDAPVTNKAARDYVRMFFAGASDETPDKQGRITLPPMLRDYASLAEGLHRDRRDEPDRDLGRRLVADATPTSRSRRSRTSRRRSSPASSSPAPAPQHNSSTTEQPES